MILIVAVVVLVDRMSVILVLILINLIIMIL